VIFEVAVVEGPDRGKRFVFRAPAEVVVGRSSTCEVPLSDAKISRRHCRVDVLPEGCVVRDLGSANGTRVNGIGIEAGALEDGDRIRVGDSVLDCSVQAGAGGEDEHVDTELPAQALAGYRFLEKLGEGAFGVVYKAEQTALGRIVAVKVLPVGRGKDPRDVARFIRGAKVEALLSHRNIVQVFDFVRARDVHVVMEYIEGEDLRRRTGRAGKLSIAEAAGFGAQILDGLQHAYERKVVHRDVKPENVIIDKEGTAKLTDFGLAKSFADTGRSGITSPDEGAGTPAYMPPEQLRSALTVDQRADIYSAGATIYHTLAGDPPFRGSVGEVIQRIQRDPPAPLSRFRADVPEAFERAILRSMSKDPRDRFSTPAEFRAAILSFAG
jgi:serine/threonine-protein kinase